MWYLNDRRWSSAGRYWYEPYSVSHILLLNPVRDILTELAYAGDVSINDDPHPPCSRSRKRRRTEPNDPAHLDFTPSHTMRDSVSSQTTSTPSSPSALSSASAPTSPQLSDTVTPPNFSLPMYSTELGRLPVYGQFSFSDANAASRQETAQRIQATFPATSGSLSPGHFASQQLLQTPQNALLQSQLHSHQHPQRAVPGLSDVAGGGGPVYPTAESLSSFSDALTMGALFDGQLTGNFYPQISLQLPVAPAVHFPGPNGVGTSAGVSELDRGLPLLDHDTMRMWSTAPTGFE